MTKAQILAEVRRRCKTDSTPDLKKYRRAWLAGQDRPGYSPAMAAKMDACQEDALAIIDAEIARRQSY